MQCPTGPSDNSPKGPSDKCPHGEAMGLGSMDGGVGNIFDSSSGLRMPVPPQLLRDVLPPLPRGGFATTLLDAESSGSPAGLLEPGGVGTCNCK